MEYTYRVFDSCLCSDPLDRLYNDAFCLLVGSHLSLFYNLINIGRSLVLRLGTHRLDELLLSLSSTQRTDMLQLIASLGNELIQFFLTVLYDILLCSKHLAHRI